MKPDNPLTAHLVLAFLLLPATAFAAAGFADRAADYEQWMLPAYYYCGIFGLTFLCVLFGLSLVCKTKIRKTAGKISSYLVHHNRLQAIIVAGLLLAIPLGIIEYALSEIAGLLFLFPQFASMIIFPICLVERNFREKCLLSPFYIKWSLIVTISAIAASLLFIVLTNFDMLSGTDITFLTRSGRSHHGHAELTHPYDSIMKIWEIPLFFIAEILVVLIVYSIKLSIKYLRRKLFGIRHRGQRRKY